MDNKLIWGTLDMLILDVIAQGPSYGYQISQMVISRSKGYFDLKEGSLYPALHRLERQKRLSSYWVVAEAGRRRKFYKITAAGKADLEARRKQWGAFVAGVNGVLGGAHELA